MRTSSLYQPATPQSLVEFIRKQPLAIVFSSSSEQSDATALPLLPEFDSNGELTAFVGHIAIANPHYKLLQKSSRAMIVFLGKHGYVSPSWMKDRSQAPTWNFEMANFVVDIQFAEREEDTAKAVDMLVEAMEQHRPARWRSSELGQRYPMLIKHVIGFRAKILERCIKFKMGQNERPDVFEDIVRGLEETGRCDLGSLMREYNKHRFGE